MSRNQDAVFRLQQEHAAITARYCKLMHEAELRYERQVKELNETHASLVSQQKQQAAAILRMQKAELLGSNSLASHDNDNF